MLGSYVKSLLDLKAHPAMLPNEDGNESEMERWINSHRTSLLKIGDDESFTFLSHKLDGIDELLASSPGLVVFYTEEQMVGNANRQAVDEDGNKMWAEESSTDIIRTVSKEVTGTEEIMGLEKQQDPDWSFENKDVLDPETSEVTGSKRVWTYSGSNTVETEDGIQYPPKYNMVEVGTGEWQDVITETVVETEVEVMLKVPVIDPIEPDPEAETLYLQFWPRDPYEVIDVDEDGVELGRRMVTPPLTHGWVGSTPRIY